MKKDIHPAYKNIQVTCACGHSHNVGTTSDSFNQDVCSACHPFYTGKDIKLDTAGRADKFNKRRAAAKAKA